jgi:hypothetical protein
MEDIVSARFEDAVSDQRHSVAPGDKTTVEFEGRLGYVCATGR